jgi:putative oxidoreductase
MNMRIPASWQPIAQSVMRMVVGFTFSCHGLQKLFGLLGGHRVEYLSLLGAAGVLETFGGLLILLGLFTRPVAFVLCGEMATAYFMRHAPRSVWPIANGGELAVLYCFLFLYFLSAGPGPWSLDSQFRKG